MKRLILIYFINVITFSANAGDIVYETVQSGEWSDASTWKNGKKPAYWLGGIVKNRTVIIHQNHKVNIKSNQGRALNITKNGFLDIKGELYTEFPIRVNTGGQLDVYGNLFVKCPDEGASGIGGSMETALSGKVNVYSDGYVGVDGYISIGTGSTFKNEGQIATTKNEIKGGENIKGRKIHKDEPSVIPKPNNFLPIALKSFKVNINNGLAHFVWVTASEQNNDYFTIEQSSNIMDWENIHTEMGAGNSLTELTYNVRKRLTSKGTIYFRLKQTDYDGHFSYSKIISANNTFNNREAIPYASISNGKMIISNTYQYLQIFDVQGQLLKCYTNQRVINDLQYKGVLILVFDNQYKQKIIKSL